MKISPRTWARVALVIATAVALSCSSDLTKSAAPVELLVTNTQNVTIVDLNGGTGCDQDIGVINVEVRTKNPSNNVDTQFNDVRITRYRVSYVRTDGGTAVPAPFVFSRDELIKASASSTPLGHFTVFRAEQIAQAPFASLLPQNGGRDPETGRTRVDMDVIVELFGQTLAGSNVSGTTRFPLEFCFDCGGCQ